MNKNNEYLYNSDDDFEDIDSEDEFYNPETYYLTDQQLDDFIYQIQKCGSQHTFQEIDALICSSDEIEVYEWCQDLNEEFTQLSTFNHIEKLLDEKYGKQLTRATPPIISKHENDKQEVQFNKKAKELKELKEQPKIKVFTQELKTQFTRAAFQHWRSIIEFKEINSAPTGTIFSMDRKEIILIELKEKFKRAAFQHWQTTTQSANLTEREPRKTERRLPMSLKEFLIKKTTQSTSSSVTIKTDTRINNTIAVKNKTFVSATIAETQSTMAYAATSNAQALTTSS
jgi:hypothetical protein